MRNPNLLFLSILIIASTFAVFAQETGNTFLNPNYDKTPTETSGDTMHNCRMWGMITAGSFNDTTKLKHLNSLKNLASANPNGWGVGFYTKTLRGNNIPVIYRGMWRADQDFMFDSCALTMLDNLTTSAITHIRRSSSGYVNVPDPHPFYTHSLNRNFNMLFAHNGTVDKPILISLLGDYTRLNHYHYSGDGGVNDPNHDSDLYRLFLMKWIDEHPEDNITTCLSEAIVDLTTLMGTNLSYNFLMASNTDTLWGLRYNNSLWYRCEKGAPGFVWEVASEPLSEDGWVRATNYYLYKFNPNRSIPDSIPVKDLGFGQPENLDFSPSLSFNFTNPATGLTLDIEIEAKASQSVSFHLYGSQGQLLSKTPVSAVNPGMNHFSFDISRLNSGIYFLKMEAGKDSQTKELIVVDR